MTDLLLLLGLLDLLEKGANVLDKRSAATYPLGREALGRSIVPSFLRARRCPGLPVECLTTPPKNPGSSKRARSVS